MQSMNADMKIRQALISIAIIFVFGVVGFFIGGTLAASMVYGNDVSAAATVALSAVGSGVFGAALGLYITTRR